MTASIAPSRALFVPIVCHDASVSIPICRPAIIGDWVSIGAVIRAARIPLEESR